MQSVILAVFFAFLQDDAALAEKAYQDGDFALAATHFEKVAALKRSARTWLALGSCYLQAQKGDEAVHAFRAAIRLKAEGPEVHRALGQALAIAGRHDEALASFREAEAKDPNGPDALWIARVFIQREDWIQAEHEIARVRRARPDSIEALESLAYVLGREGRSADAAGAYRMLAKLRPAEPRYLVYLGQSEAAARRYAEAIDALESARLLGSSDPEMLRLLSDLYLTQQMPREAAAAYSKLLSLSTSPKAEDWYRLAHAYLQSGEKVSAREAFAKVVAAEPGHAGALRQLAAIAAERGEADQARRRFAEAIAAAPASPAPCVALGDFEARAGTADRAADAFREAVRRGDGSVGVRHALVVALRSAGKKDEAIAALKEALRKHPADERLRALLREIDH